MQNTGFIILQRALSDSWHMLLRQCLGVWEK